MPQVYPVQAGNLASLIERYGLQLKPTVPLWWISDTIQPVSLVGQNFFPRVFSYPVVYRNPATTGTQINPVANTVLADTGALPDRQNYDCKFCASFNGSGAAIGRVRLQQRNAANTGDIFSYDLLHFGTAASSENVELLLTLNIAPGERFRIVCMDDFTGRMNAAVFYRERPLIPPD